MKGKAAREGKAQEQVRGPRKIEKVSRNECDEGG
jgi:hypothetical protein